MGEGGLLGGGGLLEGGRLWGEDRLRWGYIHKFFGKQQTLPSRLHVGTNWRHLMGDMLAKMNKIRLK